MEHSQWTKVLTGTSHSTETDTSSSTLDLSMTAPFGQEPSSKHSKRDGQNISDGSSTQEPSEASFSLAIIMGIFIGWPLKATVVWALLLWAALPLTLTWLQCLLIVGVIDVLKA